MWVDIAAGIIVAMGALTGAWRGTIAALMRLGTLAAAYVLSLVAGGAIAAPFGGPETIAPPIAVAQASFIAFLVIWVMGSGLMSALLGRLYDGTQQPASGGDRLSAGLLSGVRAGLFAVVVLSGMQYSNRFIASHFPTFWVDYDESEVGRWVREHNVFLPESFPRQWALERLAQEAAQGTWRESSQRHASLRRVFAHPEASAFFDPTIQRAIQLSQIEALTHEPRLQALLADPSLRRDFDLLSTGPLATSGDQSTASAPPPPPIIESPPAASLPDTDLRAFQRQ